jgi:signal transduction histidine kinase
MLREGIPIGVLALTRSEVRPFSHKQIELVTTFADQAAIAIENVRLFDEIQDKSRQLKEASQHKSQFLANMSHELRTPLNAILGYTELMADGAYGEPSEKMLGILKRLEANGRHLLGLINDVLDLSKIEAGQLVLEISDYSVQDIAQTVRSTLEPLAADKKLGFKLELAPELPPGHGDGRRLTQVLINLVGNAIKFTDAGEVAIKAEANNGAFYVSVRDTGPGISATDQAKLFQEFQQADNAITRKKGGTGLGLAISKRIIEMHGGRIWVESQPGQGSTFAFSLPVIVERQVEAARASVFWSSRISRIIARLSAICSQAPITKLLKPRMANKRLQLWQKRDPISSLWVSNCPSWTATRSRAKSRPIPRCDRSRSSPSLPTRWMGKNRQRERQDVMAMCRSLTARANY